MNPAPAIWLTAFASSSLFALGSIWFGRFEEGAQRWRRSVKLALTVALPSALTAFFGLVAGLGLLTVLAAVGLAGHFVWCRSHGIDPLSAEPYEKYRRLRGWR